MSETTYEIIILGGGMAGMTAAIYAARANRSCIILESNITGGLANSTYTVENFPSYPVVHGMDLMQKVREHVDTLGVPVEEVCEITSLELSGDMKKVITEDGVYEAPVVIIATGRKPIELDLEDECAQVHYCAICDGAPYKGKSVIVVGGGNSAFDEALYLLQLGVSDLTIVERMDRFFAAEGTQKQYFAHENVKAYVDEELVAYKQENGELKAAVLRNVKTGEERELSTDGIFVFLGQRPNSELFADCLTLDKSGYLVVDENMQTNIPGVFGAGDINAKQFRQLTTAAADGTIAALMADRYLRK